jgi:hypothetical protein
MNYNNMRGKKCLKGKHTNEIETVNQYRISEYFFGGDTGSYAVGISRFCDTDAGAYHSPN